MRNQELGLTLSPEQALQAVATINVVGFQVDGKAPRIGVTPGPAHPRQILQSLAVTEAEPLPPPEA